MKSYYIYFTQDNVNKKDFSKLSDFRESIISMRKDFHLEQMKESFTNRLIQALLDYELLNKKQWEVIQLNKLCEYLVEIQNKCKTFLSSNKNTDDMDVRATELLMSSIGRLYCLQNFKKTSLPVKKNLNTDTHKKSYCDFFKAYFSCMTPTINAKYTPLPKDSNNTSLVVNASLIIKARSP